MFFVYLHGAGRREARKRKGSQRAKA